MLVRATRFGVRANGAKTRPGEVFHHEGPLGSWMERVEEANPQPSPASPVPEFVDPPEPAPVPANPFAEDAPSAAPAEQPKARGRKKLAGDSA